MKQIENNYSMVHALLNDKPNDKLYHCPKRDITFYITKVNEVEGGFSFEAKNNAIGEDLNLSEQDIIDAYEGFVFSLDLLDWNNDMLEEEMAVAFKKNTPDKEILDYIINKLSIQYGDLRLVDYKKYEALKK